MGKHYINAANTAKYDGHVVLNWRGGFKLTEHISLFARVINLLDERYADRADYAFGDLPLLSGHAGARLCGAQSGAVVCGGVSSPID